MTEAAKEGSGDVLTFRRDSVELAAASVIAWAESAFGNVDDDGSQLGLAAVRIWV